MYLDSLVSITQTEERLKQAKVDAAQAAKKRLTDAGAEGEAMIAEAAARAEEEIRELTKKADENVRGSILELAATNENKKAVMKAKAESRMEEAVGFIVERIVNS